MPNIKPVMVKIQWDGKTRIYPPGHSIDLFRTNLDLWDKLKAGKEIEVPYEVATLLIGVVIKEIGKKEDAKAIEEDKSDGEKSNVGN